MKYILLLITACLLAASCSKEDHDPYDVNDPKAVFNALIGKWEFSRMSKDPNFKDTIPMWKPIYRPGSYFEFFADGTFRDVVPNMDVDVTGNFKVYVDQEYGSDMYIDALHDCVHFVPDLGYQGIKVYSFTDSTFVFDDYYDDKNGNLKSGHFIEIKRIK